MGTGGIGGKHQGPLQLGRRASDITAVRQQFLWNGRIPVGHVTVVAGQPSKGKSTLGYRIAADVDLPTIFVSTEEVSDTVWKPRLDAAGVDPLKAFHHPEVQFAPGKEGQLAELVERYGAKLVIVDPLSNHLRGASVHRDESIRRLLEPYMDVMVDLGFSILFQVHVLRDVAKNAHPLRAIPAGVVSSAKAVYLLGEHPDVGSDPNLRVLACADKFNFGRQPAALLFEIDATPVRVLNPQTGSWEHDEFPLLRPRGEVAVTAKALLLRMRPEDRERKSDRVAHALVQLLRRGPRPVGEIRPAILGLDPPISWRTAERVADEMGIAKEKDPQDARKLTWALPNYLLAELEEAGDDPVTITEIDVEPPDDTFPEGWTEDES